jgi:hypothetical protein
MLFWKRVRLCLTQRPMHTIVCFALQEDNRGIEISATVNGAPSLALGDGE